MVVVVIVLFWSAATNSPTVPSRYAHLRAVDFPHGVRADLAAVLLLGGCDGGGHTIGAWAACVLGCAALKEYDISSKILRSIFLVAPEIPACFRLRLALQSSFLLLADNKLWAAATDIDAVSVVFNAAQ